ncbi:DUF4124 domain-containing protein [uncultured Zhongshania sp.]|uniref:DUF4124 domain-containing protein n=1 Tax=uncultured Zhongshania sp. TaxID=1642288 RepID=UPI0030DBA791|tara:strand:- start:3414 stop:3806 length:393 start_codon:yes stop_codon:yes gene_type:complete
MIKGLILLFSFISPAISGEIYKYYDDNGKIVYSDTAPVSNTPALKLRTSDLPPLLITEPERPVRQSPAQYKKNVVIHDRTESAKCRYAKAGLDRVKKEIRTGKGNRSIEQLRDDKRRFSDLKLTECHYSR